MKLSTFINNNMQEILTEWDLFAGIQEPQRPRIKDDIRDHAKQILHAIALDIDTQQSSDEQRDKSRGMSSDKLAASGASIHGTARQNDGFTLLQLTAEYRALRATVQRLWFALGNELTAAHSADLIRFNEAIDQALSESVATYSAQATRAKDTFLAILGHDLRGPLATVALSSSFLSQPGIKSETVASTALRIQRSASLMNSMVNDLLEYARAELGGEMPMTFVSVDMLSICEAALADASALHPGCSFLMDAAEPAIGSFDQVRLQQVLTNLLNNAAQYRGDDKPVTMAMTSTAESVTIAIQNSGAVIPQDAIEAIFNPMVQLAVTGEQNNRASTSLGLGLYIAKKITAAHDGVISVISNKATGTTFTIVIPRLQQAN